MADAARKPNVSACAFRLACVITLSLSFLLCVVPVWPDSRSAPPSIDQMLRRLLLSERACNLRGRQVFLVSGPHSPLGSTTTRIVRTRSGKSLTVCLEPAWKRGAVTMDDGDWTKYYNSRARRITIARSIPRVTDERTMRRVLRLIHSNYRVTYEGEESMAGRSCYRLNFMPKIEPNRPPVSHPVKLWMDVRTGTVLSNQENDLRGNTLAVALFTSVEYPKRIAQQEVRFSFPRNVPRDIYSRSPVLRDIAALRRQAGFEIALPLSMPGGFEFDNCEMLSLNGVPVVSLRYTDGLANITICQNRSTEKRPGNLRRIAVTRPQQGEIIVSYARGSMDFMVVGRGDRDGLIAIARSLDGEKERVCMASLARSFQVTPATLAMIRNRGLAVDSIAALLAIETKTGRKLNTLLSLYKDGYCWRSIAEQLKLNPMHIENAIRRFEMR